MAHNTTKTTAFITDIQKFSLDDGPGIRDTVFFKGCNLRCRWCHNPECISPGSSLLYDEALCVACGRCLDACPNRCHVLAGGVHSVERGCCRGCGRCARACPTKALTVMGSALDVDGLLDAVLTDRAYFARSGGGVTFSGGECMLQADFVAEAVKALSRESIHTAVDTAGLVPWASFKKVLPYAGLFLYDVKACTSAVHIEYTSGDNARILENLMRLVLARARVWIRVPVIPGVNTGDEMETIARFVAGLSPIERVQLLPYHTYGQGKYRLLGERYTMPDARAADEAVMRMELERFLRRGVAAETV